MISSNMSSDSSDSSGFNEGKIMERSSSKFRQILANSIENAPKTTRYMLPILEFIYLVGFVVLSIDASYQYHPVVKDIMRYSQVLVNPFSTEIPHSTLMHFLRAIPLVHLCLYLFALLYLFLKEERSAFVSTFFFCSTKLISTALFFPYMRLLLSVIRLDFYTRDELLIDLDSGEVTNISILPQIIFYLPSIFCIIGISVINWGFCYERWNFFTDSIEGRFHIVRVFVFVFLLMMTELLHSSDDMRISTTICSILLRTVLMLTHLRFPPYLSRCWNVLVMILYSLGLCGSVFTFLTEVAPESLYPLTSNILLVIIVPICTTLMILRIACIQCCYMRWSKKTGITKKEPKIIKKRYYFCMHDPYDFILAAHWTNRLGDYEKTIEKYFQQSHRAHLYFIFLSVGKSDYRSATVLNKMERYMTEINGFLNSDLKFRKFLISRIIKGYQESGYSSSSMFDREMKVVGKTEKKLRGLLKVFWRGLLVNEEQSIDFGVYPSLITRIEQRMKKLEKTYNSLLKRYRDKPDFLKKYGHFKVLMNEISSGNVYFDLALMKEQKTRIEDDAMRNLENNDRYSIPTNSPSNTFLPDNRDRTGPSQKPPSSAKTEESSDTCSNYSSDSNCDRYVKNSGKINVDDFIERLNKPPTYQHNEEEIEISEDVISTDEREEGKKKKKEEEEETSELLSSQVHSRSNVSIYQDGVDSSHNLPKTFNTVPSYKEYSTQGSSIDSNRVEKSQRMNILSKKIRRNTNYLNISLLKVLNCCTLFVLMSVVTFLIVMFFLMDSHFSHKSLIVNEIASVESEVSTIRHLLRKMEVSSSNKTVFYYDQSIPLFKEKLDISINNLLGSILSTYEETSDEYKFLWSDIEVSFDHYVRYLDSAHRHENPLIDALTIFAKRAEMVLKLPNNTYYNDSVGYRLIDNSDYSYVLLTEKYLTSGINEFVDLLLSDDTYIRDIYVYGLIFTITMFIFLFLTYCCFYLWIKKTFRMLIKSFALIPKENILKIYESFHKDQILYITKRTSILEVFILRVFIFLIICLITFVTINGLCIGICELYNERNYEVSLCSVLKGNIRQINSLTTEVMYPESSLYDISESVEGLSHKIGELKENYETLRFGGGKKNLPESDFQFYDTYHKEARGSVRNVYYDSNNNNNNDTTSYVDYINLRIKELEQSSLNWLMNLYLQYGHMMELYYRTLTMDHEWYTDLELLDMFGNNDGVLFKKVESLIDLYSTKNQTFLDITKIVFLFVLILSVPIICFTMCCSICFYPSKITKSFLRIKNMFLFIPFEELNNNEVIMKFLTSSNFWNCFCFKSFSLRKFLNKKKKNLEQEFLGSLDFSNFIFFKINRSFKILRYNKIAGKVFNLQNENNNNLLKFVDSRDTKQLKNMVYSNIRRDHITMVSYNHHFPVCIDLFETGNSYFYVFIKNIEEEQKEERKRIKKQKSEDIGRLSKCIIPAKIFNKLDVEDQNSDFILTKFCKTYFGKHQEITAVFSDICNFTSFSSNLGPRTLIKILNVIYTKFDYICEELGLEKIKTIGDCYFCCSGLPDYNDSHALLAAEFGLAQLEFMEEFRNDTDQEIHFRIGMSSGEATTGILGKSKINYDVFGKAINEADLMAETSLRGKIQVSRSTYELIFDRYEFFKRSSDSKILNEETFILGKRKNERTILEFIESHKRQLISEREEEILNEKKQQELREGIIIEEEEEELEEGEGEIELFSVERSGNAVFSPSRERSEEEEEEELFSSPNSGELENENPVKIEVISPTPPNEEEETEGEEVELELGLEEVDDDDDEEEKDEKCKERKTLIRSIDSVTEITDLATDPSILGEELIDTIREMNSINRTLSIVNKNEKET